MQDVKNLSRCPFNGAVVCDDQTNCARCGWDPKVANERMRRITQEPKERNE